jgi:Zn-dependent M16 (insulinase) family peptidase
MRIACLDRNLEKTFEIFEEFLTSIRFDEFDHIQNLVKRSVKSRTDNLLDSGTSYGSGIASSLLNVAASQYESLKTLNHDCELVNRLETSSNELKTHLEQIHSFLLNRKSLEFLVHTSEESNKTIISNKIDRLLSRISSSFPSFDSNRSPLSLSEFQPTFSSLFYTLPIQVNYVVQAFSAVHFSSEDYATLKVLCEIMTMKALLKEVREKGGAYGSSASVDSIRGTIVLSSFRDPNNLSTFKAFDKAISAISKGKFSQRDIDEGKLGVFARVDKPLAIYDRGLHGFVNQLTVEQLEVNRNRLISVNKDQIVQAALKYFNQKSCKVVFGPDGLKLEGKEWTVSSPINKVK